MKYVAFYFGIMLVGYALGSALRKKGKTKSQWITWIQTGAVVVLIFVMSCRIGFNREIIKSMGSLGWIAFVTIVFAFAGSILLVYIARKLMKLNSKGERVND